MDLNTAIAAAHAAPDSVGKISIVEDAIRIADQSNKADIAFNLRLTLIKLCTEYGQFMKALIAFAWCIKYVDDNGKHFHAISWEYKALLIRAAAFDVVSLEKIEELMQDFRVRAKAMGATDHAYYSQYLRAALILRDKDKADYGLQGLNRSKRDHNSDCDACIQTALMQYELYFGTYEKAIKLAQPLITGTMSCNMVPLRTFGYMINYVHRAGELAAQIYKKGVKLIGNKGGFLEQIGQYLIYLANTNANEGLRLFKKALPWALNDTEMPWSLFHFHMGAYVLFCKYGDSCKTLLDKKYAMYQESGQYKCALLAEYHYNTATELAGRFDERNGNAIISDMLASEKAIVE